MGNAVSTVGTVFGDGDGLGSGDGADAGDELGAVHVFHPMVFVDWDDKGRATIDLSRALDSDEDDSDDSDDEHMSDDSDDSDDDSSSDVGPP